MSTSQPSSAKLAMFLDPRIRSVFVFGLLSGLPWVMIGSALTLWLRESGVSRTEIGYAGLIFTVFAINFLWAPVLDQLRPKILGSRGFRRSWILICQIIIAAACIWMSSLSPDSHVKLIVLIALIIAIGAATQDIAIDAYRVDLFDAKDSAMISAGAAAATSGWWTAFAGLGMIPLMLSDLGWSWPSLYLLCGITTLCIASYVFFAPDPPSSHRADLQHLFAENHRRVASSPLLIRMGMLIWLAAPLALVAWALLGSPGLGDQARSHPLYVLALVLIVFTSLLTLMLYLQRLRPGAASGSSGARDPSTQIPAWLLTSVVAPFEDFFKNNGVRFALTVLIFIVFFKIGEAFLGRMSIVFYSEIGFSNTQIATNSKLLTWIITLVSAVPCALLNAKFGLVKGLFISGICMAASNLMFSALAMMGPNMPFFIATIIVDGFTGAWATIAFVGFISMLCSHTFSATHYALMASLGALGRTTLAAFSGQMVDALDGNWAMFFALTTAMVIPGLVLLWYLRKDLQRRQMGQPL